MATAPDSAVTVIDGRSVRLTSLEKVMYPANGTTKQEVLSYYLAVAEHFVRHSRGRIATRKRFIEGVGLYGEPEKVFFEKNLGGGVPRWVQRRSLQHSSRTVTYPLVNDASTLVWCAQLGALEIHIPQWRFVGDEPVNPDRLVLDLDPGDGAGLDECAEVALLCKAILDGVGLASVPVTSGSKGIHLYAQLDGRQTSDQASQFAHELARALEADHPHLVVSDMKKALRGGKVFLDWSQNNGAKTTIAPYSLRGTRLPQVACPRRWDEIAPGLAHLELYDVLDRLASDGDAMAALAPPVDPTEPSDLADPAAAEPAAAAVRAGGAKKFRGPRGGAKAPARPQWAPMLPSVGTRAQVDGEEWAYEVKWDGYRAIATVRDGAVGLSSRNGVDLTGAYPELQELARLVDVDCVLDGEIVALDESGRPSFERLQDHGSGRGIRAELMLFDVLELAGQSTRAQTFAGRRELLEELVRDGEFVHVPPLLPDTIDAALQFSHTMNLEGIVAKERTSRYDVGERSPRWVKIKHVRMQEVVIVGWSAGQGGRAGSIGSLLMGVHDDGELRYAGKVGSGFTDRMLRETAARLAKIERRTPQVVGVDEEDQVGVTWVSPVYVAEVSFAEWSSSGKLRHAVWRGWRADKAANEAVRER